jgi:hypothetical protein
MNEKDHIVAVLTGFSMDKLLNTVDLIEAVVGNGGIKHGDRLALQFCKEHRLPKIGVMELMSCLGSAANRKMLLMNPDEGEQERTSIIH